MVIVPSWPQLARAEISSTASAMALARAHKVEQLKQNKTKRECLVFVFYCGYEYQEVF